MLRALRAALCAFGKLGAKFLLAAISLKPLPGLVGKHQITLPRHRGFEIGRAAAVARKEIDDETRERLSRRLFK